VIGRELQRRQRYQTPLSLLFLDIDQFKAVNDTFGHETGNLVLQYIASFLKEHVREADYLFRWGGDEFLVLMSCELDQAMQKGVDLKADFAAAAETAKLPAGVGLSFGCTEVPHGTEDVMPLVKEADRLMYEHKTATRPRRKSRRA
jgi:diguanylate cyclase (GGDEF)-like protein|tara:strand:- start:1206 stop:1643 length:438 start_codon:yes stop_codon:yes gene_type:complete